MLSELDQPRKSVQFSEAVQVKTVEEPQEVEINEEKIDRWDHNDSLNVHDVGCFITPQLCGILSLCTVCSHLSMHKLSSLWLICTAFLGLYTTLQSAY